MGIAKTAESVKSIIFNEPKPESQQKLELTDGELAYAEVPIDMFRFFDKEITKASEIELRRLRDINDGLEGESLGEKLMNLRDIERRMGVPHFSESRINRIWNWFKISNQIRDLEGRKEALQGSMRI